MKFDEAENMPKVEKIKDLKVSFIVRYFKIERLRLANSLICIFHLFQD